MFYKENEVNPGLNFNFTTKDFLNLNSVCGEVDFVENKNKNFSPWKSSLPSDNKNNIRV